MRNHLKKITLTLLITTGPLFLLSGCYGRFPLTRVIYKFNGSIGSKATLGGRLINTLIMWVMIIIPVYGLATLADAIIFNLIEFWTGKPMSIGLQEGDAGREMATTFQMGDTSVTMAPTEDQNRMEIRVVKADSEETFYIFKEKPGQFFRKSEEGYSPVQLGSRELDEDLLRISYKAEGESGVVIVPRDRYASLVERMDSLVQVSTLSRTPATAVR